MTTLQRKEKVNVANCLCPKSEQDGKSIYGAATDLRIQPTVMQGRSRMTESPLSFFLLFLFFFAYGSIG